MVSHAWTMDLDKAWKIYEECSEVNYLHADRDDSYVTLDGSFSIDELRAIVLLLEEGVLWSRQQALDQEEGARKTRIEARRQEKADADYQAQCDRMTDFEALKKGGS